MTAKHKGGLVVVLGVGFLLTLPFILLSTPEERQQLTQGTSAMRLIEHHTGLFSITEVEREELKTLLQEEPKANPEQPRVAWLNNVTPEIMSFGLSEHEAASIAQWVWLYANTHDIKPSLLLALITIESRFDPYATSSVGAQGLMQVMPFWKKTLGNKGDDLFDVATNIRYGSAILKHYIERYHTEKAALAAYNGSKGKDKYPNKIFSQIHRFE